MSLVGSLEDLSLGDILQIISLSQKSGVLAVQTTGADGRIVFVQGLVRGAAVKNGPRDLRGVLVGGGFITASDFESAQGNVETQGGSLSDELVSVTSLSPERIDSLCREAVESAVVAMFSWQVGNFSFDVQPEAEPDDPELLLPTGINAQYLAMEGARIADESGSDTAAVSSEPATDVVTFEDMPADEMFGAASEAADPEVASPVGNPPMDRSAADSLAMATVEHVEGEARGKGPEIEDSLGSPSTQPRDGARSDRDGEEAANQEHDEPYACAVLEEMLPEGALESLPLLEIEENSTSWISELPEDLAAATGGPLIALDDDLVALEWLKNSLKDDFSPIHIFQHSGQGLARIRQYLVRGERPMVLISGEIRVDTLSGIRDPADFVARLRSQSAHLPLLWLRQEGRDPDPPLGQANGVVTRPDEHALRQSDSVELLDEAGRRFCQQIRAEIANSRAAGHSDLGEAGSEIPPAVMGRLRDATQALTEASSRGEILPLVIRFAAELFSRVAMFMIRDGQAVGMAQHGLDRCGGPSDDVLRQVRFDARTSHWMCQVLEQRKPFCGPVSNAGDRKLAALLGNEIPKAGYLAPIETAGEVIALLYGDNLSTGAPVGDTAALEVVLHHAGLALERAALERALSETETGS